MAQVAKLEHQQEIKSSADKMYELLKGKWDLIPQICPQSMEDAKLVKGTDWGTPGSVRSWKCAGQPEHVTGTIEATDDRTKSITVSVLDGDVAKYYKNMKGTFTVTENMVKWSLNYEKKDNNMPDPLMADPRMHKELTSNMIKSLDAYLLKQQ